MANEEPSNREIFWRQYSLHVDLYKYYLDIGLKVVAFFYILTGGIVTYCLSNSNERYVKYSLLLPILLGFALTLIFFVGGRLSEITRMDVFELRDKLGLVTAPELKILSVTLYTFGVVLVITSIGLTVLLIIK